MEKATINDMGDYSRAYIIGAGASHGHRKDGSTDDTPPLGCDLFLDGWLSGLLSKDDFAPLFEELITYLGRRGNLRGPEPSNLKCDAERFLQDLHDRFETEVWQCLTHRPGRTAVPSQAALSVSYYYFYELFRWYAKSFSPEDSLYTDLVAQFQDDPFGIINLNYDTLLEQAAESIGQDFHYTSQQSTHDSIPIAKVHGSINMINNFGSGISTAGDGFIETVRPLHSNRVWDEFERMSFDDLKQTSYRDLVFEEDKPREPAIIPPLGNKKDYGKIHIYTPFWRFAEEILRGVDELIIIGSSLAIHDDQLIELLDTTLADDVEIFVVSGSQSNTVKAKLDWFVRDPAFNVDHRYFGDFIDST